MVLRLLGAIFTLFFLSVAVRDMLRKDLPPPHADGTIRFPAVGLWPPVTFVATIELRADRMIVKGLWKMTVRYAEITSVSFRKVLADTLRIDYQRTPRSGHFTVGAGCAEAAAVLIRERMEGLCSA